VLLLAFDTATPAVTVALHDGSVIIAQESGVGARRHGELLAGAIEKVLRSAGAGPGDLTDLAVGIGPGPYTGLRAGVMTAKVLASALQIPVDGICSLDVIAAGVVAPASGTPAAGTAPAGTPASAVGRDFLVATDARRREVYWALYGPTGVRLSGPHVGGPATLPAGYPVAGEGAVLNPELTARPLPPRYPAAADLAALAVRRRAAGAAPAPAEPLYLRRPDAREPGPYKRVTESGPSRRLTGPGPARQARP
jgi:tRNA threonylcarbamoyl adenosine modification protein YeaZ